MEHNVDAAGLRLAVRLFNDASLLDITPGGEEILEQPLSLSARVTQQAQQLDWTKIRSKPLEEAEDDVAEEIPPIPPLRMAKETIHKAWQEITITLDIVNRMLAAERRKPNAPDTSNLRIIPAPRRLPPSDLKTLEELELNMSAKLEHLKSISARLGDVADRLRATVDGDLVFYSKLTTELREKDWILQSKTLDGFGKTLYVDYTYANAGSDFKEVGHADVQRNIGTAAADNDGDASGTAATGGVDLLLYHRNAKRLRVSLRGNTADGADGDEEMGQDAVATRGLAVNAWRAWEAENVPREEEGLYRKLALAQATVYDSEIFSKISEELAPGEPAAGHARILRRAIAITLPRSRAKMLIDVEERPLARVIAASELQSQVHGSVNELLDTQRDNALVELLAQQALRQVHKGNRDRLGAGASGPRPQSQVFNSITRAVELAHIRSIVQTEVDVAARSLRSGFRLTVRRVRRPVSSIDTTWTVTINARWSISLSLSNDGSLVGTSTLLNPHTHALHRGKDAATHLASETRRVALAIIRHELVIAMKRQVEWTVEGGLMLHALVPAWKLDGEASDADPARYVVDVVGAELEGSWVRIMVLSKGIEHRVVLGGRDGDFVTAVRAALTVASDGEDL
ncbi:hypothetical protein HDU87_003223 [Geranomyces variabilis]|uniref:Mediator of RNA polymerase II transcription subunit 17 n=1 Tax=Geranomyces variabilis TaxID=109894 RepID=A0AAD5XNA4_9FUNG|nr:hypothetical protein HDU87_003223 [Geranomyces variabilis]